MHRGPSFSGTRLGKLQEMKPGNIMHVNTGLVVGKDTLLKFMRGARVIYVGETHDNVASHNVQLDIIKNLHENGVDFAVGMEMFKRPFQDVLNKWSSGEIDEKSFIKDVHWHKEWGMDFRLYKDILVYLKENKIPLVGLNVTQKLKKRFKNSKKEPLSPEEERQIPNIDYRDEIHHKFITNIFGEHHNMPKEMVKKFYRVQCLWEEYMAQSVADYLASADEKDKKMVVLCGGAHIVFDFGIPKRVLRRNGEPYVSIYTLIKKEEAVEADVSPFIVDNIKLLPADFFWIVERKKLSPKARMGILMEYNEKYKQVVIIKVMKESPAQKAGLKDGDILLKIDETDIKEIFDAIYIVNRKKKGDVIHVIVERGGKSKPVIGVTLDAQTSKKHHHKK